MSQQTTASLRASSEASIQTDSDELGQDSQGGS